MRFAHSPAKRRLAIVNDCFQRSKAARSSGLAGPIQRSLIDVPRQELCTSLSLFRYRKNPQLLHQGQSILDSPMLYDFAIRKAEDINDRERNLPASRSDAHKCAVMCPVKDLMGHDFIPFRHLILDGNVQIRKGGEHLAK